MKDEGLPFSWSALARWTLTALMGVVAYMLMGQLTSLSQRVESQEVKLEIAGNRITTLEAVYPEVDRRLQRIENKLDAMISNGKGK